MNPSGDTTFAVIPARGGSKSIPKKNIALLGGRPLLDWSIQAARSVSAIDRIIVSTDDDEIAEVASSLGAEVSLRPAELATDEALVIDTLHDLIARLRANGERPLRLLLLEPTCPFRSAEDIEKCLSILDDATIDSVATYKPADLNPYRAWRIENDRPSTFMPDINPWLPRQKLPPAYQLNGAVYAFRADRFNSDHSSILFGNAAAVVMPAERSVDIDSPIDLMVAEALLKQESSS